MESKSLEYISVLIELLDKIKDKEWNNIDKTARLMADAISKKQSIFIFGASHAGILAQEMFYRTGGLAVINPILPSAFSLDTRPVSQTSALERLEGYTSIVLKHTKIKAGDILLLHSVSGRNAATIDMAIEAKAIGVTTVAITNMEYSQNVSSRHTSSKKLYELCDIVIDNHGAFEDSSISINEVAQKVGPTSSVIGCSIVNMISIRVVEYLLEMRIDPPIFHSANVDGGEDFNARLFKAFKDQIHYM